MHRLISYINLVRMAVGHPSLHSFHPDGRRTRQSGPYGRSRNARGRERTKVRDRPRVVSATSQIGRYHASDKLGFNSLQVIPRARIHAHLVADVAEEGHTDLGAGLHSGGLEGVGGGVALDAGLGVGDLEHHILGQLAGEHGLRCSVHHSLYDIAVLQESHALYALAGEHDLFPGLGVQEVVAHLVLVGVLVGATLDAHLVYLHARVPGLVNHAAGLHIAELGAYESRTLAGLYVQEFYNEKVVAVNLEAHAILKVSGRCHR